ncbi:hypothetical protein NDU88_001956 [Pleurodeles waltl]|uniref:Uncharacterized protein n=1 Tax=Pleurodeles waltl TaxID=8319 RepID=A0AAV7KQV5_PLEWA|nr:hypothetical protein NDU88_001956 [Pleurodeles waltl]
MAMAEANGLEWARKMVAAQGAQQQLENPEATNTNEELPSDSGLCLLSGESVVAPAKRKRRQGPQRGTNSKGPGKTRQTAKGGRPRSFAEGQRDEEN